MRNWMVLLLVLFTTTGVFAQAKYTPPPSPQEQLYKTYGVNLFRSVEGTYFDLQNDNGTTGVQSFINILDWLQGRVAGLMVYDFRGTRVPYIRNRPAAIFIDEVRVDYGFLNALSTADIGLIKVMRTPSVGVFNAPGGAIAIYTKRGEGDEDEVEEEKS